MDKPEWQVNTSNQSYRYMGYPLLPQRLHTLYPGRLMSQKWHYTGDNIPSEDPIGLQETQAHNAALTRAAEMEEEALERHLGGRNKISRHPPVEPEATIEDPSLKGITIQTPVDPETSDIKSPLDRLQMIEDNVEQIARGIRAQEKTEDTPEEIKKAFIQDDQLSGHPGDSKDESNLGNYRDYLSERDNPVSADRSSADYTRMINYLKSKSGIAREGYRKETLSSNGSKSEGMFQGGGLMTVGFVGIMALIVVIILIMGTRGNNSSVRVSRKYLK